MTLFILCCLISARTIGSEPEPIESRQFSSKDKIATAGIFGSGGKSNGTYAATPQSPGSTVPQHPPTTDESIMFGKLTHNDSTTIFVFNQNLLI